jgi:hypothetical protein
VEREVHRRLQDDGRPHSSSQKRALTSLRVGSLVETFLYVRHMWLINFLNVRLST